jgi:hypothetical protein
MRKARPMSTGFESPTYTQIPNDFFDMISDKDMTESEIRVTLIMLRQTFGFHRQGFKMSMSKLADAAGMAYNSARSGALAAEQRGTFRRVNPDSTTKQAEWELVVNIQTTSTIDTSTIDTPSTIEVVKAKLPQPLKETTSTIEVQVGLNKEINNINKGNDLEAGTLIDARQASCIFSEVTGLAAIPPVTQDQVIDVICSMVYTHGSVDTKRRMKAAYDGWLKKRGKNGVPYSRKNTAWLDFALVDEVPANTNGTITSNQSRINSDGSINL